MVKFSGSSKSSYQHGSKDKPILEPPSESESDGSAESGNKDASSHEDSDKDSGKSVSVADVVAASLRGCHEDQPFTYNSRNAYQVVGRQQADKPDGTEDPLLCEF
jgi:hypothetical protein